MLAHTPLIARVSRDLGLTRALLARMPEASLAWRPHPRSFTLAGLGTHLARLPHWGARILAQEYHDLALGGGPRDAGTSRADILALFDRHVVEWDAAMASADAATLAATWQLRHGTTVLASMSHADAVEQYLLHHMIHHRGQLTVYLRLLDVPLLPLYGPTADPLP